MTKKLKVHTEQAIRDLVGNSPVSKYQLTAISVCFVIFILDGFDALVMAFTGPSISEDWQLSGVQLGTLFSSSLFGMAVGAIFVAPFADRFGRRPIVLFSLVLLTLGMFLSALTATLLQLVILRVLTGVGVGTVLASVNIIVAEYSPAKSRGLAIGIVQTAYPLGAMIGGAVAAVLIAKSGWESVFVAGGIGSLLLIPVAMKQLPESIDYLLSRRPPNALENINRQLARMGLQQVENLPPQAASTQKVGVKGLLTPEFRHSTLRLWFAFFMVMFCLYFILSWTPKLLIASGLSSSQGISGGVVLHLGGIAGQLALGFLATRLYLKKLLVSYFFLAFVIMLTFAFVMENLQIALFVASLNGFFILGAITGCYTITCDLYPTEIRTTGLGWALGIGRFGAIASPLIAGFMLDQAFQPKTLFVIFSFSMLLGMFAIATLPMARRETQLKPGL